MDYDYLQERSKRLRRQVIELAYARKGGHIGGALSIVDILVTLYNKILTLDDVFILSKGHACLPYYIILKEMGYNPSFIGHPERDVANGVMCTAGSLGHGLPQGVGMAIAKKLKKEMGKVFVLMSDAECQEGTTWESLLLAAHYRLDNLTIIIDNNGLQTLGKTNEILSLESLPKKFDAFNIQTRVISGHAFEELIPALHTTVKTYPLAIIANTIKGKGVSYMENVAGWHTMIPNEVQFKQAMMELR